MAWKSISDMEFTFVLHVHVHVHVHVTTYMHMHNMYMCMCMHMHVCCHVVVVHALGYSTMLGQAKNRLTREYSRLQRELAAAAGVSAVCVPDASMSARARVV